MTEEEIAKAAEKLDPENAYIHFDHYWNLLTSEGGIGFGQNIRDVIHQAFEAGIYTGEARAKVRASSELDRSDDLLTPEEIAQTKQRLAEYVWVCQACGKQHATQPEKCTRCRWRNVVPMEKSETGITQADMARMASIGPCTCGECNQRFANGLELHKHACPAEPTPSISSAMSDSGCERL